MGILEYTLIIAVLVMLSAYFSATETAFSSINKTRLKAMAEKGNKRAQSTLSLAENYDKLISTILIGNNIVNIAASSIGTVMFVSIYGDIGATISTAVITVVVLIFGEITPKSIAKDSPERFAMFSTPAIRMLIWVLTPLNFLFTQWKKLISKIFKSEDNTKMSQEELLMIVEEVEQDGSLDTDEGELIRNAIEFTEQKAEDILTHRVDLEGFPFSAEKAEIAELFTKTQFSRLLVYGESIDDIIGIVHLKDFFTADGITKKALKDIMTKPVFIQKSEKVNDILKILQQNKSHIAVVIDEYGGTLGIVTMEDILEELVGEIWDEHDEVVLDFEKTGKDTYKVDCSANFEDFCEVFEIEAETESISVGGWVMEQLGKIPENGESFEFENLNITITETDSHRVTQITVLKKEKEPETASAE
ncbi:MAG: HlyC/CorC family transporter [Oscillospiraceae bacterium]|nr:HlyC/CorC family transporter [Oscillospiraceae bacterium]MBQ4545021.1 HlyC/CorC family transporter [Oscillospiraceae bacterium]